jgi:hypothetical protein
VYTAFAPYSPSFIVFLCLPYPSVIKIRKQDLFYPHVLWFCIQKKRKKNEIIDCLRQLHRKCPCGTSMFMWFMVRFGSSLFSSVQI